MISSFNSSEIGLCQYTCPHAVCVLDRDCDYSALLVIGNGRAAGEKLCSVDEIALAIDVLPLETLDEVAAFTVTLWGGPQTVQSWCGSTEDLRQGCPKRRGHRERQVPQASMRRNPVDQAA